MKKRNTIGWQDWSFLITLAILGLSLINVSLALIGALCYIGPFVYYLKYHNKTWCQKICPRASFLNKTLGKISLHLKRPTWLGSSQIKSFFVIYLSLNLFFAIMSTIMVGLGRVEALLYIRLFMFYKAPFILHQLIQFELPLAMLHFSYRILSMMSSTLLIGLILGFLYTPRMWCTICPVNTLSKPKQEKAKTRITL